MGNEKDLKKIEEQKKKSKKKRLIAGVVVSSAVLIALGVVLRLASKGPQSYVVDLKSQIEGVGLTGNGKYKKDSTVTIEAETIEGYTFSHWNFNDQKITENPYTFTLNKETSGTYQAVYEINTYTFTVNIDGNNTEKTITHGTILSDFLTEHFADVTDYNSCGWYYDENYTNVADLNKEVTEEVTLYTRIATPDKLEFVSNFTGYCYVQGIGNQTTGEVVIPVKSPDGNIVTSVIEDAFDEDQDMSSGVTSVYLPTSIKNLDYHAYYDMYSLEKVNFPNTLTEIPDALFESSSCPLKTLILPGSIKSIGIWAFDGCPNLENIIFQDDSSLEYIGHGAFDGTVWKENLKDGEHYIGKVYYLFKGTVSNNTSIVIKEGTKSITGEAFKNVINPSEITSIVLADTIESIGESAFQYTGISSLIIPSSVTSIESYAFFDCSNLTSVTFAETTRWYALREIDQDFTDGLKINSEELMDLSTAASYLTNTYSGKYWKRNV